MLFLPYFINPLFFLTEPHSEYKNEVPAGHNYKPPRMRLPAKSNAAKLYYWGSICKVGIYGLQLWTDATKRLISHDCATQFTLQSSTIKSAHISLSGR